MSNNRNWLIECAIVAVIVILAVGAVYFLYCVAHDPCDLCAYRVADWVWVLLQYGMAGAFGGFLTYLARFHVQTNDPPAEKPTAPPVSSMTIFVYCMGGVGGAYAVLFFLAQSDKMNELKMENAIILKNIVTGVVAGFLGFPLLLRISESAEGILGKAKAAGGEAGARAAQAVTKGLDEKTVALQKTIELTKKLAEMQRWLQHAIRVASDLWRELEAHKEVDPGRLQSVLSQLEDARRALPEDRIAAIVLANLYRYKKEYARAVEIVSETLALIELQAQEEEDASRKIALKNAADLLWNRANYFALLAREGEPGQRGSWKEKMYADLERSLELSSENVNDIEDPDPDFGELVKEERFAKLIAKYKKPAAP